MSVRKLEVVGTNIVHQGRVITLAVDDVVVAGVQRTFERVEHPGAVVVLPIASDGRLLFIRQYRHALGKEILELPAGTLEAGEAPMACAAREVQEEVQHKAGRLIPLGMLYPAPGFCNEVQHLFVALDLSPASAQQDDDEEISLCPLTMAEAEMKIRRGEIVDAKSIALLFRGRLAGFL